MVRHGDVVKADVKMKYVYTLEDAFSQSRKTGKPIFFNCFADWAIPCHGMNKEVFSNKEFCDYMDKNFVCLFMDLSIRENPLPGARLRRQCCASHCRRYASARFPVCRSPCS